MNTLTGVPSGTVTLVFTDIEGSTWLWEAEPEPMAAAPCSPVAAGSLR